MDRKTFRSHAAPLLLTVSGTAATVAVRPREFNGGCCGWTGSDRVFVRVAGEWVLATAQVVIRVDGSRGWPEPGP